MSRVAVLLATAALALFGLAAAPLAAQPADYSDPDHWLCLPGRESDACTVDLEATAVAADGTLTREAHTPDPDAAIDCFYVYPTVSLDPGGNSDLEIGAEERRVILQQFARFTEVCRPFAPLYRQVTLTALRAGIAGQPVEVDRALGYSDVVAAWKHYLEHHGGDRGFVLVGHSQGAGVLTRLVQEEIDGQPIQQRLVSALILGSRLQVAEGSDRGGDFENIPLCRAEDQTGCAIAYASFRDTVPPPANSRFGRAGDGTVAACTNPAALAGGRGTLHPYFATAPSAMVQTPGGGAPLWVGSADQAPTIETPFVTLPGLLEAECRRQGDFHYLEVEVIADPADPRADDIPGDVRVGDTVVEDWGLHLIDVDLAIGDLVRIVGEQARAFAASR
ncbi:MAG: DUF3089 domain-containing protein [Acidobacteria bacterium]|nr:MAG: DUF3089 domain-containing protein [Acidobacteriota bacterium]REK07832.1 MAG: DUF3089 domain-containing protein [Acidobacteriota bacterium]